MLPYPTEYGINSIGKAERLVEILKVEGKNVDGKEKQGIGFGFSHVGGKEKKARALGFKRLLVDFTKEKEYAMQRCVAEILDLVGNSIEEVTFVDREEPSEPPRLIQRLIDSLVSLKRLTKFNLKISSRSGGVSTHDIVRMLRSWKSLQTLELGGFSVDDHPLTLSQLSLPHLTSLTFTYTISICRPFIRHLVNQTTNLLTYLDLTNSSISSSTRHPFILPANLLELHSSNHSLLKSPLPRLIWLRLHTDCQNFDFLVDLPSLSRFAFFCTDFDSLDSLNTILYSPLRSVNNMGEAALTYYPETERKTVRSSISPPTGILHPDYVKIE
jgi:hypothetical protein